jgi:hypothetical protein
MIKKEPEFALVASHQWVLRENTLEERTQYTWLLPHFPLKSLNSSGQVGKNMSKSVSTVRLTSTVNPVPEYQEFCLAPSKTIVELVKK